jgi:hypothetical protein
MIRRDSLPPMDAAWRLYLRPPQKKAPEGFSVDLDSALGKPEGALVYMATMGR